MATKDQVVEKLAQKHYALDGGLTHVFRINAKPDVEVDRTEPIKLLEVNEDAAAVGVVPIGFRPSAARGVPYRSIIVEVTPAEFKKLKANDLELPSGWTIGELIPKPATKGRK